MEVIQTFVKGDKILKIVRDEDPINPIEWDTLGIFATKKTYCFSQTQLQSNNLVDAYNELKKQGAICILDLYKFEHGNFLLSTKPFNNIWDSCQIGYIYTTQERCKLLGINPKNTRKVKKILDEEVKTMSCFCNGNVFGYVLFQKEKCNSGYTHLKDLASCSGFYTDDLTVVYKNIQNDLQINLDEWKEI